MADKFERKWKKGKLGQPKQSATFAPATKRQTGLATPKQLSTAAQKAAFIKALHTNGGLINRALETSTLPKRVAYDHLQSDPAFREAWMMASEITGENLMAEALERATVGVQKYRVDAAGARESYREKSDTLLIFLIKHQDNRIKWRQRVREAGNTSLQAVRDVGHALGMTEDQVQGVQNAILEKFKNISLT